MCIYIRKHIYVYYTYNEMYICMSICALRCASTGADTSNT